MLKAQSAKPPTHVADTSSLKPVHHGRLWNNFHYPVRQYFVQGQGIGGFLDLGVRITAGYRLGRFAIIGGGIGVERIWELWPFFDNTENPYGGVYFPIFVHYEGDISRTPVSPFYAVELGYAARYNPIANYDNVYITVTPLNHPFYGYNGGFTGSFDFGVKIYTRRPVFVALSLGAEVFQYINKYSNYYYNSINQLISVSYRSSSSFGVPNIKITCGF
jgi:hypothetical protein